MEEMGEHKVTTDIHIPPEVGHILDLLKGSGHQACVCGGCVRDALLGKEPSDWDVTTSAKPEEVKSIFEGAGMVTVDTGLKHGTVTALSDGMPVEITTYRVDGEYTDGRHPDRVVFTDRIEEDLARRDFTINAMALGTDGILDPFGGTKDLQDGILRCVEDPRRRFEEDALRIMRALRFAASLGYVIEAETEKAAFELADRVRNISSERVTAELTKLVLADHAREVFDRYGALLEKALGMEIAMYRDLDMNCLPKDLPTRLAALTGLDFGRLRFDNRTKSSAKAIAEFLESEDLSSGHSAISIRRLLRKYGPDTVRAGSVLQGAETKVLDEVLAKGECFSLRGLAIGGKDLLEQAAAGGRQLEGHGIGELLDALLDEVIEGKVPNDREALLDLADRMQR